MHCTTRSLVLRSLYTRGQFIGLIQIKQTRKFNVPALTHLEFAGGKLFIRMSEWSNVFEVAIRNER